MTACPTDERDPLPPTPHEPVSSEWARRNALEATRAAVAAVKERRKKQAPTCTRCGDTSAAGCEDWDCHLGWGAET